MFLAASSRFIILCDSMFLMTANSLKLNCESLLSGRRNFSNVGMVNCTDTSNYRELRRSGGIIMYSQPQMFTDSEFYFLSKQLNLGITGVWQELHRDYMVDRNLYEFLPYTNLAQN